MAMSTKAYNAALRGVPAQFTDIFTSLQGGQAPLTVLLQQGGQLKDMFGGVGNAARAMGGYVLGLVNPFTVTAAVVGALTYAYKVGAEEDEAYNKSMILTGNIAGTTAGRLSEMAATISEATGGTKAAAADALQEMVGYGTIAEAQFKKIGAVATEFAAVTDATLAKTVEQFSDLGREPVKASLKLNETTHYLTATIYEQIRALDDQGEKSAAAALAQNAWADALEQRIPALRDNLGLFEKAWRGVTHAVKSAGDAMLSIGRDASISDQIAKLQANISDTKANLAYNPGLYGADLKNMQAQLVYLQRLQASMGSMAVYQADRIKRDEASIALAEKADKYASKQVQMQREIAQAQQQLANSNKTDQDYANYAKSVAGIADKFKEAKEAKATITEAAKGLALYNDLMDAGSGYTATYAEDQQKLAAALKTGAIKSYADYATAVQILVDKQPFMVKAHEAEKKAADELAKVRDNELKAHATELASLTEKAQKLEDEATYYGMSKTAIEQLTTARMLDQIEVLRGFDNSAEEIARIEQVIAARKRLAAAGTAVDLLDANKKAAEVSAAEWKKGWEDTDRLARDVFVTWAEDGANAAQKIGDTLEKALLSAIYEATLKPVVFQIYGSITGGSSLASAAGSDSGVLNGLSNASSLANLVSGGYASALSAGVGALFGQTAGNAAMATALTGSASSAAAAASAAAQAGGAAASAATSAASIGSTIATAFPYVAAAVAVASLFGGSKKVSSSSTGGTQSSYDAAGNRTNYNPYFDSRQGTTAAADAMVQQLQDTYMATAKSLGIATAATTFTYAGNTGRNGADPQFYLGGSAGNSTFYQDQTKLSDTAVQLAASRAVFAALKGSELPKHLSGVFDGITASTATQEQITAALQSAQALTVFHSNLEALPFAKLADLSYAATQKLIGFAGSLDALQTNLAGYYTNFYSQEEQRAQLVKNINATVGNGFDAASMTAASFRAAVAAAMADTSDAGLKLTANLLSVQGSMSQLITTNETAAKSAYDAQRKIYDSQISAAQAAIDEIGSVFDVLKSNVADLYGQAAADVTASSAFIDQALATALKTGYLPDSTQLSSAISAARSGVDSAIYASQADADFARLELAGRLDQLKTISGNQLVGAKTTLSIAESQLTALDSMQTTAKAQLEALQGISGMMATIGAIAAAPTSSATSAQTNSLTGLAFLNSGTSAGFSASNSVPVNSLGNTDRLEKLVEALTKEVEILRGVVATGNGHASRTAELIDSVTEGGNAMRSEIMRPIPVV
nr:phage tail length tape measure family protein [Rhodoferax sp. BLA1]